MRWRKLGQIFQADGQRPWMRSHTAVPTPLRLEGELYRIFFGTRDARNRPHIGFIDVDLRRPLEVVRTSESPVLGPGPLGFFDDNGVYPSTVLQHGDELWMYYLGRSNGVPPLYYMAIGLAASRDGGETFERKSPAPVMDRSEHDPWMVSCAHVHREDDRFRMWYLSGLRWEQRGDGLQSYYHIKYADSLDGVAWDRQGAVCIDLAEGESNIASPTVLQRDNLYHMWYCRAGARQYQLGYAVSEDGRHWRRRDDEAGMSLSESGWDSEAIAYPQVFEHDGATYMVYSGNGFGRGGFGIAISET